MKPAARKSQTAGLDAPPLHVFVDGACPFCRAQAAIWRRMDCGRRRIFIQDINAPDFDAGCWGLEAADLQSEMHAVMPGGRIERGVDAIGAVYAALGWRWLGAIARWPPARRLLRWGYRQFADHRPRQASQTPIR